MNSLNDLCAAFGIDQSAAQGALDRDKAEADKRPPWFVMALMAVGSWIAALVIISFGGFFLALAFELGGDESFGFALAVLGVIFFAGGFALLRRESNGMFADQFGTAIAAAGQGMVAVGAGMHAESALPAALLSLPFSVAIVMLLDNRILQALSSGWTLILFLVALNEYEFLYPLEVSAAAVAVGVFLILRPTVRDLAPTAMVFLLLGPVVAILADFRGEIGVAYEVLLIGWPAKVIYAAIAIYLFYALWLQTADPAGRTRLALFAAAAAVLGILLPPGGSAAIVILVLAFSLGSRMLAALGILLQIYFLSKFYYDLDMTLLVKSMILVAAGLIMLGLWAVMMRAGSVEQKT